MFSAGTTLHCKQWSTKQTCPPLTEPTFISASWVERKEDPDNEKIYIFFREKNLDQNPEADPWISRVARVCKVRCTPEDTYVSGDLILPDCSSKLPHNPIQLSFSDQGNSHPNLVKVTWTVDGTHIDSNLYEQMAACLGEVLLLYCSSYRLLMGCSCEGWQYCMSQTMTHSVP